MNSSALVDNNIGKDGAEALAKTLNKTVLTTLNVGGKLFAWLLL